MTIQDYTIHVRQVQVDTSVPAAISQAVYVHAAINIQQLARKREERLGVVEYELRVTKEDLAETQVL